MGMPWIAWGCLVAATAFEAVSAVEDVPRPEHPRPDLRRDTWATLNGPWQFRFDPDDCGLDEKWWTDPAGMDRRIIVPFCWSSRASGIADQSGQKIGWYHCRCTAPEAWRGRQIWLRFGAVDEEATVWVDGIEVGRHQGGSAPFEFNVTQQAEPGRQTSVVVRVRGAGQSRHAPSGQTHAPTDGIWQTVWLEARPVRHVRDVRLVPRRIGTEWSLEVEVDVVGPDGSAQIELVSPDGAFPEQKATLTIQGGAGRGRSSILVPNATPWSPERPRLYDLDVHLKDVRAAGGGGDEDVVHTYFGLRIIERGDPAGAGRPMVLLNGEPIFLRGVVDRSTNPEGLCTAPSEAVLRRDVEIARRLGVNLLRTGATTQEPRRLYWADRLGILVMADVPATWSADATTQESRQEAVCAAIRRDRNHPAIVAWCLVGDVGQRGGRDAKADEAARQWAQRLRSEIKERVDPTRLVGDDDPLSRKAAGKDFGMWRLLLDDYTEARQHVERVVRGLISREADRRSGSTPTEPPLLLCQYGGVVPGGGDRDVSWSFRYLTTLLRQFDLIQGYVYNELTDVEWEHDGLVNYDRTSKEFGYGAFVTGMTVADLQGADFVGYDAPPLLVLAPDETFTLPVFVSHYSSRREAPRLRWQIVGMDDLGQDESTEPRQMQTTWRPHCVTFQKSMTVAVPSRRPFVGALTLELLDDRGDRIAANYVNLIVRPSGAPADAAGASPRQSPRVEVLGRRLVALRFSPDDFSAFRADQPMTHWLTPRSRFFGYGHCEVEYRIALPEFVRDAVPVQVVLMAELATKARDERLDWPAQRRESDCPQTEHRKYPGKIAARLAGKPLWRFDLPDDPADSRGVLSHEQRWQHGSYGYLVHQRVDLFGEAAFRDQWRSSDNVPLVFEAVEDEKDGKPVAHGLSLFGERLGRYPMDPTLVVATSDDLRRPPGWTSFESVAVNRLLDRVRRETGAATAAAGGHVWRYATQRPEPDWLVSEASTASWRTGSSAFGQPGTPGVRVRTDCASPEIWLRTDVELGAMPREIVLDACFGESIEVFVNGKPLWRGTGGNAEYHSIPLSREQKKLFRTGRNTVAVHARQGSPPAALDVGLEWIYLDAPKEP
ncbi:MAG: hypothetical protein JW809_08985 [Pirellulales bacterium]|nr:hypothetical protein [Pirellulales bacterium]